MTTHVTVKAPMTETCDEKRVDVLNELIDALEKSFPVTDLTDAMIRGLKKLELKYLSDLDEHFESIYNYLDKIYEAEVADPYTHTISPPL